MYHSRTYINDAVNPWIAAPGIVAADVVIIDRNGIGVKHGSNFQAGTLEVDVYEFQWYGVKRTSLSANEYINIITQSVGATRITVYEIGSTVTVGRTYSFYDNNVIAKYTAIAGDDANDVRNGLVSAINAATWSGFTATVTNVSTTRLQVEISDPAKDFKIYIGQQKWKSGYFCTIDNVKYIIYSDSSTTSAPTLPAISISYAYGNLTPITGSVQSYNFEPLTGITYAETLEDTTDISGVSSAVNVADNTCVVSEGEQKIYFDADLGIGEIIKVFSK